MTESNLQLIIGKLEGLSLCNPEVMTLEATYVNV